MARVREISEQVIFDEEDLIENLECEIEHLTAMIRSIVEKKKLKKYQKKFKVERLRWIRVYNSLKKYLKEKENKLEELYFGAGIE